MEALGHRYAETITQPTCEKKGYATHTCSVCGDTYTDNEVEALGHNYTETVTAPTCETGGYTNFKCDVCGDGYIGNEVEALGHDYTETVIDPTCTEKGYTIHECDRCGDTYTDSETDPTGHEYAEAWSSDNEFHWHEVLCGCDVEPEKQAHEIEDEECGICGKTFWKYKLIITDNVVTGIEIAEGANNIEVKIPSGVVEIGEGAFRGRTEITSVEIPDSVKKIGANAFTGSGLQKATIARTTGWSIVPPKGASTSFTWGSVNINADKLKGLGDSYLIRR